MNDDIKNTRPDPESARQAQVPSMGPQERQAVIAEAKKAMAAIENLGIEGWGREMYRKYGRTLTNTEYDLELAQYRATWHVLTDFANGEF